MNSRLGGFRNHITRRRLCTRSLLLAGVLTLCACENRGPSLESLRAAGVLRVAMVSDPHTYNLQPDGLLGLDHDLLKEFCARHKLRLQLTQVGTRAQATDLVAQKKVHLAAGFIPVTTRLDPEIRFGPSYSMLQAQVIYRSNNQPPREIDDLIGANIETAKNGLGDEVLLLLAKNTADLHWEAPTQMSSDQLLLRVHSGLIDYAVVPANDFVLLRLKYPRLAVGFDVGGLRAAGWALSQRSRGDFYRALTAFFADSQNNGLLSDLWDRYYGHLRPFDFVDARALLYAHQEIFPNLRESFITAANKTGLDWRLLAALGYQESHWDPQARSPTGVRGLMMLTRATAKRLQVSRLDSRQAIDGGARYLTDLLSRLPNSVVDSQRLWFALAAYNIGSGHLEDARRITQRSGASPNRWPDVRRHLPLLANISVANTTRYGVARGAETVHFVRSIRRYFDTIRQLEPHPIGSDKSDPRSGNLTLRSL